MQPDSDSVGGGRALLDNKLGFGFGLFGFPGEVRYRIDFLEIEVLKTEDLVTKPYFDHN